MEWARCPVVWEGTGKREARLSSQDGMHSLGLRYFSGYSVAPALPQTWNFHLVSLGLPPHHTLFNPVVNLP